MSSPRLTKRQRNACLELLDILSDALECFDDETQPLWMNTLDGMRIMDDLPFAELPKQLQQQVEQSDAAIEAILGQYNLNSWQDYQFLSQVELLKIQNQLLSTINSLTKLLLPHQ